SDEQPERLVVDAIFRIIQETAGGLRCPPLTARRVMREQISQVAAPHCLVMIFEGPPCPAFVPRSRAKCFGSYGHSVGVLTSIVSSVSRWTGERVPRVEIRHKRHYRCRLRENRAV